MKIELTKKDKILIAISVILYIVGFFIGGWNIFFNLILLFFVFTLIKKSYDKGKLVTLYLIFLMIFIVLNILIKIGFLLNLYQNYSLKKSSSINTPSQIIPNSTPTIYICPKTDQKTKEDIDQENAEKNLSSYTIKENLENPYPDKNTTEQIDKISILEKKLLPCESRDEQYCTISNTTNRNTWSIKYPKAWKLFRIKRKVSETRFENTYENVYYDLKFEYNSSYFYLRESTTLGGNPIILSDAQWSHLSNFCSDKFYTDPDKNEDYICSGNIIGCAGNMEGDKRIFYPLNNFYNSFISINRSVQPNETLIYNWYIPSLNFEREEFVGALRIYTLSDNFYSNDKQFISELRKIYLSLQGKPTPSPSPAPTVQDKFPTLDVKLPPVGKYCSGCYDAPPGVMGVGSIGMGVGLIGGQWVTGGYDKPTTDRKWNYINYIFNGLLPEFSEEMGFVFPGGRFLQDVVKLSINESKEYIKSGEKYIYKKIDEIVNKDGMKIYTFEVKPTFDSDSIGRKDAIITNNYYTAYIMFDWKEPSFDTTFDQIINSINFK